MCFSLKTVGNSRGRYAKNILYKCMPKNKYKCYLKIIANCYISMDHSPWSNWLYSMTWLVQYAQIHKRNARMNIWMSFKIKNYMIISTDTEKCLWKNPIFFHGKSLKTIELEVMYFSTTKEIYNKCSLLHLKWKKTMNQFCKNQQQGKTVDWVCIYSLECLKF